MPRQYYSGTVLLRFGKWLVVVVLVCATGGHWAALQSAAWAGMIFSYSQTDSLSVALEKTFSGQHPCKLCKVVEEGKKSERQEQFLRPEIKFDLFCAKRRLGVEPPVLAPLDGRPSVMAAGRFEEPLLPPPRLV